ncbi:ATP-binding cassette sub- C member 8 [Geranomyces variabilis]|nr:ATP-binding cassette sub- C member 8 [Geranomyces variabilis]
MDWGLHVWTECVQYDRKQWVWHVSVRFVLRRGREGSEVSRPSKFAQNHYTDPTLIQAFDARIDWVLNYKMASFNGRRLGELDELVLAFEPENEPFVQLRDDNPILDGQWLCNRAKRIRARLKGSKILVATGGLGGAWEHNNIRDSALKSVIYSTLKDDFKDTTVLAIAHRLNSLVDFDRILVLSDGEVVQFESTRACVERVDGPFMELLKGTGQENVRWFVEKVMAK